MGPSLAEVRDVFVSAELNHALWERTIFGVYYWPVLRCHVGYELWDRLVDPTWTGTERRATGRLARLIFDLRVLSRSLRDLAGLVRRGHPARRCVLSHRRKAEGDGDDLALDRLTRHVIRQHAPEPVLVLDRAPRPELRATPGAVKGAPKGAARPGPAPCPDVVTVDGIYLMSRGVSRLLGPAVRLHPEFRTFLRIFGTRLPRRVRSDYARRIVGFMVERALFNLLFSRLACETLSLSAAYAQRSIVAAAHDQGLRVIDFQHGLLSRYSLFLTVPSPDTPTHYDPDVLSLSGRFWQTAATFPRSLTLTCDDRCRLPHAAPVEKVRNRVIFLSQGAIEPAFARHAIALAALRPDLEIVYRAHPKGPDSARAVRETGLSNLRVDTNGPVESTLRGAAVQVGVYSTALLAGMLLECRTVLLTLPGIEQMEGIIANGDAVRVSTVQELSDAIETAPKARDPTLYGYPWR